MIKPFQVHRVCTISVLCVLLIAAALFAGCTSSTTPSAATPEATGTAAAPATTVSSAAAATTVAASYTPSEKTLIVFTAASLTGVSEELGKEFSALYPEYTVVFNLAGTQAIKTQVENGAYADVFLSASNKYTNALKDEGYFINSTVKPFTTNYVTVILPVSNPFFVTPSPEGIIPAFSASRENFH